MKARLVLDDAPCTVDLAAPAPLSWPLRFDPAGHNPEAFGLPRPTAAPVVAGSFVGDVARGGSVNCYTMSLCTHGAGTHTECRGHITPGGGDVHATLDEGLLPATVVTVHPAPRAGTVDEAAGKVADTDRVIVRAALEASPLLQQKSVHHTAIVVRAVGQAAAAPSFTGTNPPYFTPAAIDFLRELGCRHLVTDLPSIDREDDGGGTPAHKAFFAGEARRTITEMARIEDAVHDGRYLLDLQVPPFVFESAPSRPLLFAVRPEGTS